MAIEQYTGVTKVDENYYEVTAVVELDETNSFAVGDMADCTFVASAGGVLKFKEGTSTFTNCTFLELSDAWNAPVGQYYTAAPNNPRFLSPNGFIFKGCTWVLGQNNCAWETATNCEINFLVDDFGEPCRVKQMAGNTQGAIIQVNSSDATYTSTISGLVFDIPYVVTLEQSSDTVKGVRVKDNDPGNYAQANVGFQIQTWDPDYAASLPPYGTRQRFYELEARCVNVQLAEGANRADERAVVLVDPIGRILKTTDTVSIGGDYQRGILETWRTLSGNFIDIATKAAISSCRTVVTKDSDSSVQLDVTAGSFSVELKQLEQGLNSQTVVEDGDYTAKFLAYGYDLQSRSITIEDTTNPQEYDQGAILLFADSNITETNRATVDAYTDLSTTPKVYDRIKSFEKSVPTADFGTSYVSVTGSNTLDFGDKDVYFGDYSGNIVTYFDSDYTTPVGKTPGDVEAGGLVDAPATANVVDATFTTTSSDYSGWATYAKLIPGGFEMSDDGTRVFSFHSSQFDSSGAWITQLSLSTPFDLSTATVTTTYQVSGIDGTQWSMAVGNGGTVVALAKANNGQTVTLTLTNAWDLTTGVTQGTTTTISALAHYFYNLTFNHDGTKIFFIAENPGTSFTCRWHTLSTPWDITTAGASTYESTSEFEGGSGGSLGEQQPRIRFFDSGTKALFTSPSNKTYMVVDLATAGSWPLNAEMAAATTYTLPGKTSDTIADISVTGTTLISLDVLTPTGAGPHTFYMDTYDLATLQVLYGAPNSLFIQSSGITDGGSDFTTLKTTGTVNFLHGTSTTLKVIDANGTLVSFDVNDIVDGSRIQLYNVTQDTELANEVVSGNTWSYNYATGTGAGFDIAVGDQVRVRLTYQSGQTARLSYQNTLVATISGGTMYVDQTADEVYNGNAIDGSTVTEFTADLPNVEIDVNDPDGLTTVQRMYAWYVYFLTTEAGIRQAYQGFVAVDSVNYEVRTAVLDMNVQNIGTNAVIITGGRFYRDDGNPIFIAGNGPIQMEYGRAYAVDSAASISATYNGQVVVSASTGTAGVIYPQGIATAPVSNLADAITIAEAYGLKSILIRDGAFTLTNEDIDSYSIEGQSPATTTLTFSNTGESVNGTRFHNISITGTGTDQFIFADTCSIENFSGLAGEIIRCGLKGTVTIAPSNTGDNLNATLVDCFSNVPGTGRPTLDMNPSVPVSVSIRRYSGGLLIINCDHADDVTTVEYVAGKCEINSTCTAGNISIRGNGLLTDNSVGTTVDTTALVESQLAAIKSNQAALNTGIKKASKLIPYNDDLE